MSDNIKYQFLIPCYNEEESLKLLFDMFGDIWSQRSSQIIFVDDGSTDSTLKMLTELAEQSELSTKIVELSRNFGKDRALMAGLQETDIHHPLILMDADCQHSPDAVVKLMRKLEVGEYDIVFGTRSNRDYQSKLGQLMHIAAYKTLNVGQKPSQMIRDDVGDFFACNSRVIEELKKYKTPRPFWKGYYAFIGFRKAYESVDIVARASGTTKFNFLSKSRFLVDGLTSFSMWPLRMLSVIGFAICLISLIFILITLFEFFKSGTTQSGFYTLFITLTGLIGFVIFSLGVLFENMITIVHRNNSLPDYVIREVYEIQTKKN